MKLDTLEPDFKPLVEQLLAKVGAATNRKWGISDGRRTMAQQRAIYSQGRTTPGKVVSNAKPGQSAHNFGYAVDIWPMKGDDFDWSAADKLFKVMADIAESLGLTAGYNFKSIHDAPHVELAKWKTQQARWKAGEIEIV